MTLDTEKFLPKLEILYHYICMQMKRERVRTGTTTKEKKNTRSVELHKGFIIKKFVVFLAKRGENYN